MREMSMENTRISCSCSYASSRLFQTFLRVSVTLFLKNTPTTGILKRMFPENLMPLTETYTGLKCLICTNFVSGQSAKLKILCSKSKA